MHSPCFTQTLFIFEVAILSRAILTFLTSIRTFGLTRMGALQRTSPSLQIQYSAQIQCLIERITCTKSRSRLRPGVSIKGSPVAKKRRKSKRNWVSWTGAAVADLRRHSKAKTPVKKLEKIFKRTGGTLRQKASALGLSLGHRKRRAKKT